jgi:hypothetical protein
MGALASRSAHARMRRKNNVFALCNASLYQKPYSFYLDGFIFMSIHGIHLNYCHISQFLDNFDVFLPDLTNMREKYLFLHFSMWGFTKNLSYVLRWVYFCEYPWDSPELLPQISIFGQF